MLQILDSFSKTSFGNKSDSSEEFNSLYISFLFIHYQIKIRYPKEKNYNQDLNKLLIQKGKL